MDKALEIAPKDPLLLHMKGMCSRRQASGIMKELLRNLRYAKPTPESDKQNAKSEAYLRLIVEDAKKAFNEALNIALDSGSDFAPTVEYSYTSQIQLLLDVLDFGYRFSGAQTRTDFITSPTSNWYLEQLDATEYLMERVKSLREGDKPSHYIIERQKELDDIYDDHSTALQRWNSFAATARTSKYIAQIHRQIVVNLLERDRKVRSKQEGQEVQRNWSLLPVRDRQRIVELMEENLIANPSSDHDIRYWFHAVRYLPHVDIASVIEKVANWRASGDSLEADYYLYILYALQAIDGDTTRLAKTKDLIRQTRMKALARNQRRSTHSFEWYGKGQGLSRLTYHTDLGEWDREKFYQDTSSLERLTGTVTHIEGPSSGTIELECGLEVFFVPSRISLQKGIDEYTKVSFYLGFSYSGLRAWSVERLDSDRH